MSVFGKLTEFVGGSLFKEIKEGVMAYFPPDMNPQQKAEMELNIERMLNEKQRAVDKALSEATVALDNRIAEQEGTAKDLREIPFLGPIIIFLRGVQRPTWGFATLWMDTQWFFESHEVFTDKQETALIVINLLVLGFLFGERTIKNLEPLIIKILGNK